jgi:hypothetical protein
LRPQQIEQLKVLQRSYQLFQTEKDPEKSNLIATALLAGLQPLGPHLLPASSGKGYLNYLSAQQEAELQRLNLAWEASDKDYDSKAKPLHFVGFDQIYTLTHLSVPLIVQAPPSSIVIFQTHGGGFFSNKLTYQQVQANNAGLARVDWVTYGDSVGDPIISVRSEAAPPAHNLTISTVQLQLVDLPELPIINAQAPVQPKLIPQDQAAEASE